MSGRAWLLTLAAALGGALLVFGDASTAANVLLLTMTIAAGGFCLLYAARSRWRSTAPGRALMYTHLALFAVGLQVSASVWLGDAYLGRGVIRLVLYLGLTLTLLNTSLTLLRIQNSERNQ
ncbi:hypothetical protein A6F55_19255 [Prescottella equi]|uniref:putative phage holin n=1 Tax=Rhodococcus hoagii TaxID=43767 RepID=UPI000A10D0E6|nr:hypothetical protein [Prescottella equi]ORL01831.1 hypothetical protein A6F55_19255 [Prescottella equi]